jgi:hypothetical protein
MTIAIENSQISRATGIRMPIMTSYELTFSVFLPIELDIVDK